MLDFLEISNKMRHYVCKLYNHNKNIYLANSIDITDLQQEVLILAWKLIEDNEKKDAKYKKEDILLTKYIVRSIFYLINDMRRNSEKATGIKRKKQDGNDEKTIKTGGYINKINNITLTEDEILSFLSITPKSLLDEILFWEDIKSLCEDRGYQLLYKKFYEGKTIKEIAQELQISTIFVKKIYTKTLSKLRKVF